MTGLFDFYLDFGYDFESSPVRCVGPYHLTLTDRRDAPAHHRSILMELDYAHYYTQNI
jgi:hypothetical protein